MSAFDGSGNLLNVYFDSDSDEINLSLSDFPDVQVYDDGSVIRVRPGDIQQMIDDLVLAHYFRTGYLPEGVEYERYL